MAQANFTGWIIAPVAAMVLTCPMVAGAALCKDKKKGTLVVRPACTKRFVPASPADLGLGIAGGGGLTLGGSGLAIAPGGVTSDKLASGAVGPANVGTVPAVRLFNSADESVPNYTGGPATVVTFDSKRFDSAGLYSASNPSRLTAPIAGLYLVSVNISWDTVSSAGARELGLRQNGTTIVARDVVGPSSPPNTTEQSLTTVVSLAAGDYVEVTLRQNSGGPISLFAAPAFSPEFSMVWIGPGA